jgi:hypothetical protein
VRTNSDKEYARKRRDAAVTYKHELLQQNQFDLQLYEIVRLAMLKEVMCSGLWKVPGVQEYLSYKSNSSLP